MKLDSNNQYIIDNLPNNIEELELGEHFNLELNNLPTSINSIIFSKYSKYNKELNCLPNFVELIQLPEKYNLLIANKPKELKKIICSKNYIHLNDLKSNYEVETY